MEYCMLLWPHANARYQQETLKLAEAELRLMLDRLSPEATVAPGGLAEMPSLTLAFPQPPQPEIIAALAAHSLMYGLFARGADGALRPVCGRAQAAVGSDLPAILKYKGKTNEMFLQLLLNAALYAGDFWARGWQRLELLDPMCGRATGLFVAANRGWNAVGADVDRDDLREAERFFKRYLEYHRFKHDLSRESRTLKGTPPAAVTRFDYAATPERFKADPASLSLVSLDAARVASALGKDRFHIIACDLPYGVRHDAQLERGADRRGNWLETLLKKALPEWKRALKAGGTIAVSFNAQNFPRERVLGLMEDAGLEVLRGGAFDGFEHWVEQAITRDIAICKKVR